MPNTTNFNWTTPADTDLVKDGALAIRTLANGIDTSLVDLKGGTTGQVLAKATNTDLDFSWVAQDDSNAIQNAIIDAKGDLIVGTAADTPARLAVGNTNGMVLTVDSTEASGMKWAAASGGGTSWTLLNSGGTALTAAQTITVSGISGKNKIMVLVYNASSANTGSTISLRLNTDTGNNYYVLGNTTNGPTSYSNSQFSYFDGWGGDRINIGKMSNNAGSVIMGYALLDGCNTTGVKSFQASGGGDNASSEQHRMYNLGGYYDSASTISSISIFSSTGNFDSGTVYVYTSA